MGIPVANALSRENPGFLLPLSGNDLTSVEGEVELSQSTGYSKGVLYINGLKKGAE